MNEPTTNGVSKKVFIGALLAEGIISIATTDDAPQNKLVYVYVLAGVLVIYLGIQAFLDYTGRKKVS